MNIFERLSGGLRRGRVDYFANPSIERTLKVMTLRAIAKGKVAKAILLIASVLVGGYWLLFGWVVYTSPLTYAEMDLNHDGKVEYMEMDYAASYGEKKIEMDGLQCIEYFAYKDGLPLKVVCAK